eukprot:734393-Pleurochrysis_carterae.AAC.1
MERIREYMMRRRFQTNSSLRAQPHTRSTLFNKEAMEQYGLIDTADTGTSHRLKQRYAASSSCIAAHRLTRFDKAAI